MCQELREKGRLLTLVIYKQAENAPKQTTMSPVKPSEFDVDLLTFAPLKIFNGGAIIAVQYDGKDGLELKIPAGRVSFDCGFGKGQEEEKETKNGTKSKKVGLLVELPCSPEFEAIRGVLAKVDKKFRKHLHDEADNICSKLGLKSMKDKLRTGDGIFGLLRTAKDPKYSDSIALKWAASADGESEIPIVDTNKNIVNWKCIKQGSTVEAFVDVKAIWVHASCVSMLTDAIGLKVNDGRSTTKKKMSVADMFEEDIKPVKRQRVAGSSSVEGSQDS